MSPRDFIFVGVEPTLATDKKKWVAVFENEKTGRTRRVKFGQRGYDDFTIHGDRSRRASYRDRHRRDLRTRDPMRPGYLSWFILWNKPTLSASVEDYRRRFNAYRRDGNFLID